MHSKRYTVIAISLVAALGIGAPAQARLASGSTPLATTPLYGTTAAPYTATNVGQPTWGSRLIITMAPGVTLRPQLGAQLLQQHGTFAVLDLGRQIQRSDFAQFMTPGVISVEPDIVVHPAAAPVNDNFWSSQWDLSDAGAGAADYSIHAPDAWTITTGSAALTIAVIDTGITNHADLAGRTVAGYDFVSDLGAANDGTGRDADPSDPGDWVTRSEASNIGSYFYGCQASPSSWHGTHVAGTIAASANNSIGIAGINWASKIQPVRALGKCGGYLSDIADAITWASGGSVPGVPANATPAKVINLSLGGTASCNLYMQSAINAARAAGSIIVVAAGNDNTDASAFTPANCNGVIAVAATGRNGKRASYSNYGSIITVAAPGGSSSDTGILSTINNGTTVPVNDGNNYYASYQGTSMATPHVAGVISLLLSKNPALTQSDILELITKTATPFPPDTGGHPCSTSGNCGAGVINAASALATMSAGKLTQQIVMPTLPSRVLGEAPFSAGAAVVPSNLAPTYATNRGSVCTTDGTLITLVGRGTCTVTATQAGTGIYNAASSVSTSFTVLAGPTVTVNSRAAYTANALVSLALTFPAIAGTVDVSNGSDFSVKTTSPIARSISWTLAPGDGPKMIYLRVSGGSMASPVTISGAITLDTTGPVISSATATARGSSSSFLFRVAATDAGSGNSKIAISTDAGATTIRTVNYASSFAYTSRASTFWVRVQDKLGNWSAWTPVVVSRT
jgi:serine protease